MRKIGFYLLTLSVAATSFAVYDAKASDPMGQMPILERMFDEFTPKGFKLGRFNMSAGADVAIDYTSNTTKSNTNQISERIYKQRAELSATTSGDNSELTLQGQLERSDYQKSDDFDRVDGAGYIGFVYDINPAAKITLEGSAVKTEQTRYDTGTINALYEPVEVRQYDGSAKLRYKPGTIRWNVEAGITDNDYEDTNLLSNGARLVQRDRNNTSYRFGVDAAFERLRSDAAGGLTPFLGFQLERTRFDRRDFSQGTGDFTGNDQSNWRYNVTAGVEFSPTGKMRGQARVGYGLYEPDDSNLDSQKSGVVDIDLTYLYSPLTNFIFGAERFFTNNTDDVGGTLETRLSAKVIHELTRRWILDANLTYIDRQFSNDAEDQTVVTGAGFTHRINDRFSVLGDVKYISRESNQQNGDYDETRAMIRLNTRF
jgi:hypothetical protein